MKIKKILALVLVAVVVLLCASCSKANVKVSLGVTPDSVANLFGNIASMGSSSSSDTNAPAVTPSQPSEQPSQSQDTTPTQPSAPSEQPSQSQDTTPSQPSTGAPTTKAEIVKYYCDAYNKLGSASAITRTYDYTSNYKNILNIDGGNSTLEGIAGTLMNQFMVENTDPLTVTASDLPPVGSATINIDANKISKATCEDKGNTYVVTLYSTGTDSDYEIDSQVGTGSVGSFGPLLRADDVSGAAGGFIKFEGLHSWYATASVTAQIDKATGRITALEYKTPCILHFDSVTAAIVVKVGACEVGLLFNQKYTVNY